MGLVRAEPRSPTDVRRVLGCLGAGGGSRGRGGAEDEEETDEKDGTNGDAQEVKKAKNGLERRLDRIQQYKREGIVVVLKHTKAPSAWDQYYLGIWL